jgi:glycosyltransferase involved in cell wall biosynthesis
MLPPILYFGNDWFADNRTSSHHVARQLARRTKVLYMETPGLRPPQATSRDLRRLGTKLARALGRRHEAGTDLVVRTLPQLPLHGSALARALNAFTSRLFVRGAVARERMHRPIVWCTVPHVAHFVERIDRSLLVYHCIDDYSALPGVDVAAVRMLDERLSRAADLVVAASGPVFEAKRRLNVQALLMPHGVDIDHFARAQTEASAEPVELKGLSRPLVGFFGLIERWIDLDLVGWLAEQLPQVTFVMIGRVAVPADQVPKRPNIIMLGPRPYEILPSYGRYFDAAIIPYRLTDQVMAANPLKLREYLAMGLPVVSVSTPEIDQFSDVVAVTHTREEFLQRLVDALGRTKDPQLVAKRIDAVRGVSWKARVDGLLGHVESLLDASGTRPAAQTVGQERGAGWVR